MGLFDLPRPLFDAVDGALGAVLPAWLRLLLWGVLAGWMTMVLYRRLSNQDRIKELKQEQKAQQAAISNFDGEFEALLPLIRHTLSLGFRQLGLAIGPALLATVPVLFLVAWVAGAFGYERPEAGQSVAVRITPEEASVQWLPAGVAATTGDGFEINWPGPDEPQLTLMAGDEPQFALPWAEPVPVIHVRQWWNWLFGNPIGYLPSASPLKQVELELTPQQFVPAGPGWLRGWMFTFFGTFLIATLAFKFLLRID